MEKENSTLGWRSVGTSNDRSGQNKMETYNTSAVRDNAEVLGLCCATKLLNNNNNNTPCYHHDHKVIARVHSVRVMNVEQRLKRPPTLRRSHWSGLSPRACRPPSPYYYSTRKLISFYRPMEGRRLSWSIHCRKGAHGPCPAVNAVILRYTQKLAANSAIRLHPIAHRYWSNIGVIFSQY